MPELDEDFHRLWRRKAIGQDDVSKRYGAITSAPHKVLFSSETLARNKIRILYWLQFNVAKIWQFVWYSAHIQTRFPSPGSSIYHVGRDDSCFGPTTNSKRAFCACNRLPACCQTTLCEPSSTSADISSPL